MSEECYDVKCRSCGVWTNNMYLCNDCFRKINELRPDKKRYCYSCGDKILFSNFYFNTYVSNYNMTRREVEKVWESDYVKICCCGCIGVMKTFFKNIVLMI